MFKFFREMLASDRNDGQIEKCSELASINDHNNVELDKPEDHALLKRLVENAYLDNSVYSQQNRILQALYWRQPISTTEMVHELDILAPGRRVSELRKLGLDIRAKWVGEVPKYGKKKRRVHQYYFPDVECLSDCYLK
ncbi:helix-turn-helix domain-containing protein [Desulfosediminicola sp.]|uniref:helix-turn-helix domain-containing protein n=1 Tax=Desulfosediminicola sp. TaxID=2886825 RepID=UPI003AF2BFE8